MVGDALGAIGPVVLQLAAAQRAGALRRVRLVVAQLHGQAAAGAPTLHRGARIALLGGRCVDAVNGVVEHGLVRRRTLLLAIEWALVQHVLGISRALALQCPAGALLRLTELVHRVAAARSWAVFIHELAILGTFPMLGPFGAERILVHQLDRNTQHEPHEGWRQQPSMRHPSAYAHFINPYTVVVMVMVNC